MWYKNTAGRFFGLVTKHACADGQTDGQNYDSQDRASIAASLWLWTPKFKWFAWLNHAPFRDALPYTG